MQTTKDLSQICDNLGICYDVKFLDKFNNTKDNHGTEISTKKASVCWGNKRSKGSPNIIYRAVTRNGSISGVLLNNFDGSSECVYIYKNLSWGKQYEFLKPNKKIVWKNSNIKFDNAIYGGPDPHSWHHMYLTCQAELYKIKFVGQLFKPDYNMCRFLFNGTLYQSKTFDVLVYDT
ncbi:hypothetical protein KQX54_005446 [Cotesia glomerata]|uniref:Uncharacterized protein n=1 Tax=Cotesia glomerata TaxID=32391 RepID=A0AAV7ID44_COTGL|nr:hypothetical protein KQX54_005446 [Cotesia glomerata]